MRKTGSDPDTERYLTVVYRLHCTWEATGDARANSWMAARWAKTSFRSTRHSLRSLIDATSGVPDRDLTRRWERALRYAAYTEVEPHQLEILLKDNQGIEGCSRRYSRSEERRYLTTKEKRSTSPQNRVRAVL